MPKPQLRSAASNGAFIMKAFDHVNRNINIFLGYEKQNKTEQQQQNIGATVILRIMLKLIMTGKTSDHAKVFRGVLSKYV